MITIGERLATARFAAPFDIGSYELFLGFKRLPECRVEFDAESDSYTVTTPARYASRLQAGLQVIERPAIGLSPHLTGDFEYEAWIVRMALEAKRFAIWADTGLGKTAMFLEWAYRVALDTGERVLIIEPGNVISQTIEESARFYGTAFAIERIESREQLIAWCTATKRAHDGPIIGIVNPEKFLKHGDKNPNAGVIPELRLIAGAVLDEASILKAGGGVIKWNLIKSCKGLEYKLPATATPAPNEVMEYASQASFLERISHQGDQGDFWQFFSKTKTGDWYVKAHAREAFYNYMAGWSIYMRDPAHFGFADILKDLPPAEVIEHEIVLTSEQTSQARALQIRGGHGFFNDRMSTIQRSKLSQLAKGFMYVKGEATRQTVDVPSNKPAEVVKLALQDLDEGRQAIIWTVFDQESVILEGLLSASKYKVASVHGYVPEKQREQRLDAFRHGNADLLICKAAQFGYGMNFQHATSMTFSGFDDSFERVYQAIRRCYRFGQTKSVRVHWPYIPELEGLQFETIGRKQAQFDKDTAQMEAHYRRALGVAA